MRRIDEFRDQIGALKSALAEKTCATRALEDRVRSLETETRLIRASTSWRVTWPLRAVRQLFGNR